MSAARWAVPATLSCVVALLGCGRAPREPAAPQVEAASAGTSLRVVVCIGPQAFLAKRVGGAHVRVTTLVAPGQSPHDYEPSPRQVADLESADLYLEAGMPFEATLLGKARTARPDLPVVDTLEGLPLRHMEEHGHDHEHGAHEQGHEEAGEGSAESIDPHVWLAPKLAARQAAMVASALSQRDEAHAADYAANLEALTRELDELDAELMQALAPLQGSELFVYHPAYGYFADAYGLEQVAIEAAGKEPSAKQLAELIEQAKARGVRVVFVQRQFPSAAAHAVAEAIGGSVVPLDDLAEDYVANLREMAASVKDGLAQAPAAP